MKNPWEEISIPPKDVNALRASSSHSLDFFWAKDHLGHYLFIYEYNTISKGALNKIPELEGINAININLKNDISRLILILIDITNWEIFMSLCQDLMRATKEITNSQTATSVILNRLIRWQEFLKKKRLDILSEEKIRGLLGELIFLHNYLFPQYGSGVSINFWIGPEGTPQDFNVNNSAVEVKCKLCGTSPSIKISSVNQLHSLMENLYLFVVTLGKATPDNVNAMNLPSIISQISNELEIQSVVSFNKFQDLLLEAGYFFSEKYLDFNYIILEEKVYVVKEGFPRICPNDIIQGILNVTYNIDLNECLNYEIDLKKWEI